MISKQEWTNTLCGAKPQSAFIFTLRKPCKHFLQGLAGLCYAIAQTCPFLIPLMRCQAQTFNADIVKNPFFKTDLAMPVTNHGIQHGENLRGQQLA